jgi:hypothetical protein
MATCDVHKDTDLVMTPTRVYGYTCDSCGNEISGGGSVDKGATVEAYCFKCSGDHTDKKRATRSIKTVYMTYCPRCLFDRA